MRQPMHWRTLAATAVVVAVVGLGLGAGPAPAVAFSAERLAFPLALLRQHAADQEAPANAVLSPLSLYLGLGMSYVASGGETRAELARVLGYPAADDQALAELTKLRQDVLAGNAAEGLTVKLANGAWLDSRYAHFRQSYREALSTDFGANCFEADFAQAASAAREINQWTSKQTGGLLPGSMAPAELASRSRPGVIDEPGLVTVNALYFHGQWGSRFDLKETRPHDFRTPAGRLLRVPMMHQRSLLVNAGNGQVQLLVLPYVHRDFAMVIFLPREVLSPAAMLELATPALVGDLVAQAGICEVDVLLPRLALRSSVPAATHLAAMGVKDAFDSNRADFDRMIVKQPSAYRVYLSTVQQDAMLEVTEEGTKGAAATRTTHYSIGCAAKSSLPVFFHADRPFLYQVVHWPTQAVLLAGWVTAPGSAPPPAE